MKSDENELLDRLHCRMQQHTGYARRANGETRRIWRKLKGSSYGEFRVEAVHG